MECKEKAFLTEYCLIKMYYLHELYKTSAPMWTPSLDRDYGSEDPKNLRVFIFSLTLPLLDRIPYCRVLACLSGLCLHYRLPVLAS